MLVTKKRLRSAFPDGLKINCMRPSRPAVSCRSAPVFVLVFVRSLPRFGIIRPNSRPLSRLCGRQGRITCEQEWGGQRRWRDWDQSVCTVGHSGNSAGSPVAMFNLISGRSCWREICQVCVCVLPWKSNPAPGQSLCRSVWKTDFLQFQACQRETLHQPVFEGHPAGEGGFKRMLSRHGRAYHPLVQK